MNLNREVGVAPANGNVGLECLVHWPFGEECVVFLWIDRMPELQKGFCYQQAATYLGKYIDTIACERGSTPGYVHRFENEQHVPCISGPIPKKLIVPTYIHAIDCKPKSCNESTSGSCSIQGGRRRKTKLRRRRTVRRSR